MCSRLDVDAHGRPVVVIVRPSEPLLEPGLVFRVLGNDVRVGDGGFGWFGRRTSRKPTLAEMKGIRAPTGHHLDLAPEPDEDELGAASGVRGGNA